MKLRTAGGARSSRRTECPRPERRAGPEPRRYRTGRGPAAPSPGCGVDLGLPTPSLLCPELAGKRQEACGGRKGPPATASSLRHTRRRAAHWGDLLPRARCPLCLCPARCNQLQGTRSGCAAARALRTAGPAERPRRRTPGRWGEGPREEHPRVQARWAWEGAGSSRLRLREGRTGAGERACCSPSARVPREVSAARRP